MAESNGVAVTLCELAGLVSCHCVRVERIRLSYLCSLKFLFSISGLEFLMLGEM